MSYTNQVVNRSCNPDLLRRMAASGKSIPPSLELSAVSYSKNESPQRSEKDLQKPSDSNRARKRAPDRAKPGKGRGGPEVF